MAGQHDLHKRSYGLLKAQANMNEWASIHDSKEYLNALGLFFFFSWITFPVKL